MEGSLWYALNQLVCASPHFKFYWLGNKICVVQVDGLPYRGKIQYLNLSTIAHTKWPKDISQDEFVFI